MGGKPPAPAPPDRMVTFTWTPPIEYEDGSALFDLAGFSLYLNGSLYQSLPDPAMVSVTLGLSSGDYTAHLTATDDDGTESAPSNSIEFTVD